MMQGDMGWFPSKFRRKINMLRFWNHLIAMKGERLPKKLFIHVYNHHGVWCQAVKKILIDIGLEHLYQNKRFCDLKICEELLHENYKQEWFKLANKKSKLKMYLCMKQEFGLEKHKELNLTRKECSVLSQLR